MPSAARTLVLAGLAACACAAPASAAPLEMVVQDDAVLIHRPAEQVRASMQRLRSLGADRVRLTANWSVLTRSTDAEEAPVFDQADPAAYEQGRWASLDRAVVLAREAGLAVLMDLGFWGPHWATSDPPGPRARTNVDPTAYAAFVAAAVRRYDGTFVVPADPGGAAPAPSQDDAFLGGLFGAPDPAAAPVTVGAPLPLITQFALWNEPNHPSLLGPQWRGKGKTTRPASPGRYRAMIQAATKQARAVRPDAELLIGNTSSSAGAPGRGAVPPLKFARELACVDRALRPLKTPQCAGFTPVDADGWAHHPYNRNRRPDLPARVDRPDDVGVADLGKLTALLDALVRAGRFSPGTARVHVTEFGYETDRVQGRPTLDQATQARWMTWAERIATDTPGVVSFAQFLLQDQPPAPVKVSDSPARAFGQYGTGLDRADGTPKLAARAFGAGLFATVLSPARAELWVRLRRQGEQTVVIQERRDGRWRDVATRPLEGGGPAARSFTAAGRSESSRTVPRRRGSRFRLVLAGGAPGVAVPVAGPLR